MTYRLSQYAITTSTTTAMTAAIMKTMIPPTMGPIGKGDAIVITVIVHTLVLLDHDTSYAYSTLFGQFDW